MWFLVSTAYFFAFPTRIIGKKYLKYIKKNSAILSYNHQTNNDPILIKAKVCPRAKMMAKDSLFKGKLKSWLFRTLGAYPVNREGNDIVAVKTTLKLLKDNYKIGIAPEGTRVKSGESVEFKNGVVRFALKTDSYIVPIFLLGNIGMAILYNLGSNIMLGEISYITKAITAVLQLGVTTDFSIFLYHKYEDLKKTNKDKKEAMELAINDTFKSVIGSSLTTIAGFLALCSMDLTLGKDIGLVMAKGVLFGLLSKIAIAHSPHLLLNHILYLSIIYFNVY